MANDGNLGGLSGPLREVRARFDALASPHRPALWRYCLRLTGSAWDAEDLVQEALLRAFGRLPDFWQPLEARAYLFRIATNAWIDAVRRARREIDDPDAVATLPADPPGADPGEAREAIEHLVAVLPPRQRVVFLLTEAFDFRAAEVAAMIGTTEGAVKAALHRARASLRRAADAAEAGSAGVDPGRAALPPGMLERYIDAFNRRDPDAIAALLDEGATIEIVGDGEEQGREVARQSSLAVWASDPRPQWAEAGIFEGRPVVLVFYRTDEHPKALAWLSTFEAVDDHIVRHRLYFFCPELLWHAAGVLGVPAVTHGYRFSMEIVPGAS